LGLAGSRQNRLSGFVIRRRILRTCRCLKPQRRYQKKKNLLKLKMALVAFLLACAMSLPASASIQLYGTRTAFDAAVTNQTLHNFEAQNPYGPSSYQSYGNTLSLPGVQFTLGSYRLFVFGEDYYYTPGLTSSYLNHNSGGGGDIVATFTQPVYSIGMDLGQLTPGWGGPTGSITVNLSTGDSVTINDLVMASSGSGLTFVGLTSDVAIVSVTFNDQSDSLIIDNFAFSTDQIAAVPEPASLAIWGGLGLAGLVAARRRKKLAS
jgi:hypothetical protein